MTLPSAASVDHTLPYQVSSRSGCLRRHDGLQHRRSPVLPHNGLMPDHRSGGPMSPRAPQRSLRVPPAVGRPGPAGPPPRPTRAQPGAAHRGPVARPREGRHRGRGWRLTQRGQVVAALFVTVLVVGMVLLLRGGSSSASPPHTVSAQPAVRANSTPARATPTTPASPRTTPSASVGARTVAGVPVAVTRAVAAAGGSLSVAVFDATTGRTWTFHDHPGQVEASVSKLSILGAILRSEQAGASRSAAVAREETRMIGASDNAAADALFARVGRDGLEDYQDAVGADDVAPNSENEFGLDLCSAADQVKIMRGLAYHNAVLTDASRAQATALLDQVESSQRWGATGGIPSGVSVEVKNGWLPHGTGWVVNTVGHVHGAGRDYVVAIMSSGNATEQAGIDRLEQVSAAVWATAGT